jgi:hypothetical protein
MILANVILPIFFYHGVLWVLLLVPVVFIEAVVLKKMMGWKYGNAVGSSFYANLVSTILGIPIVAVVTTVIALMVWYWGELIFPSSANEFWQYKDGFLWANDNSKAGRLGMATALLLFPLYWYISSLIEFYCLKKKYKGEQLEVLKKACFRMNAVSYTLLVITYICIIFYFHH